MYDATSEPNEFVGEDRDGAVAEACRFFGVEEGELKIVVPEENEVSGLGSRTVIVAAPAGFRSRPSRDDDRGDRGGRERGGRERGGRERGGRERGGRERGGRDREGGDGGGRERGGRERGRGGDRDRDGGREGEQASPRGDKVARTEPSKGTAKGDLGSAGQFVLGVIERMNVGSFEIAESEEGEFLIYQVSGEAAATLGEGDGRAIDALQLLSNQAAMQASEDSPRVVIDVEGSADRREETMERLGVRAARRAQDTGRSIALDPMNGAGRRLIHMAIRDLEGVATMSIGEGRYRQVLVVPEGAPEYEDALKAN